jgi:hypothetical protein
MLPPPPPTLAVVATARETRILLDHGRPRHNLTLWKRGAVVGWFASFALSILLTPKLCWVGLLATCGVVAVYAIDLARVVMAEVVLREDGLHLVHRRWTGLAPRFVAWDAIREVGLSSASADHRGRDAVRVAWNDGGLLQVARFGIGRNAAELAWMLQVVETLRSALGEGARHELRDLATTLEITLHGGASALEHGPKEPVEGAHPG